MMVFASPLPRARIFVAVLITLRCDASACRPLDTLAFVRVELEVLWRCAAARTLLLLEVVHIDVLHHDVAFDGFCAGYQAPVRLASVGVDVPCPADRAGSFYQECRGTCGCDGAPDNMDDGSGCINPVVEALKVVIGDPDTPGACDPDRPYSRMLMPESCSTPRT